MIGIDYPTIEVGGKKLVVRYSLAAQLLMKRRGVNIAELPAMLAKENPGQTENLLTVFSACVAENFFRSEPSSISLTDAPNADYWATQIEPTQLVEVMQVVADSMGKVSEALRQRRVAAPPQLALAN